MLSVSLKYVPPVSGTVSNIDVVSVYFISFCKPKYKHAALDKQAVFALKHVIWFQVGRRTALGRFMCGCGRQKNYVAWSLRESILLLSGEGVPVICYGHHFQSSYSHCFLPLSRFLIVMFEVSCFFSVFFLLTIKMTREERK